MRYLTFFAVFSILFFTGYANTYAQDDPRWEAEQGNLPPTCDYEFMQALEARSWMEGKRELEYAQKLILKPDSTLEYSCFSTRLNELNSPGASWSNRKANMSGALQKLVRDPMNAYLGSNFSHTLGGGTFSGNANGCDAMYKIWDFLKCEHYDKADFSETFATLASNDPRQEPTPCPAGSRTSDWNKAIQAAFPTPSTPAQDGGMNDLKTFDNLLNATCSQTTPIPTGVRIRKLDGTYYDEKICITPGCSWNPGDANCN